MSALCRFSGAIDSRCYHAQAPRLPWSRVFYLVAVVVFLFLATGARAAAPVINVQPLKQTVVVGASYTFSVAAGGTAPLAYQWQRDGSNLADKTNSSLVLTAIQTNAAGLYTVIVSNPDGSATSIPARLTVRLPSDPVYPAPPNGWAYVLQGNAAAGSQTAALDGTWDHTLDYWAGDGRGASLPPAGGINTSNGVLTIEDAATTTAAGFNNRKLYLTHNLALETGVTNASTLLNDGVTLTFRARLTPASDPRIEITNAPNGGVNNTDGKGMFGLHQAGGSGMMISFSLNGAVEDTATNASFTFGQAGLHMNNLNGNVRSANVDPGEGGSLNLLAFDPAAFHEFWITIQDNGGDAGTHRVSIYMDGSQTPSIFNVTAGSGSDGPFTNYLALGIGSIAQRGALDVDFFGYAPGVIAPAAFNQPVGIQIQPVTQYVPNGQPAIYNVGVTGTPPYGFQWYRDGAPISGATNGTYATAPAVPADEGAQFLVTVTNDCGSATSSVVVLHLLGAPIITAQPLSLTVTNGDPAAFSVTVSSPVTPSYQWRFNGGNLSNQTNATLLLATVNPANAGAYDIVITNNSGSVTSSVATLAVIAFDFGDAPDPSFPTLKASNGARHLILPGIRLGPTIDADLDGQPGSSANGDDLNGSDDEDGVTFNTVLWVGHVATVSVVASTNGLLNAWLDLDRNGSWSQPGEQIFTNTILTTGTNTLQFPVPANASPGAAFARFRFSTAPNLAFDGPAPDGEVEDYSVAIVPLVDVSVAQTAAPDPVAVNAPLIFTHTVSNAGPSIATSVLLSNVLPATVTFLSATASQGDCALIDGELICDLGALGSGTSAQVTLVVQPATASTLTNLARVGAAEADLVSANNAAQVTVIALLAPSITTQPQNRTTTNGQPATFTVVAAGAAPLRYQWRHHGIDLPGMTNATLLIPVAQPSDAGDYTAHITNAVGPTDSAVATLTVLAPPAITAQPQSHMDLAGGLATFTVTATGTDPLGYQWWLNNTNTLPGATNSILQLANLQKTNAGGYRVVITNVAGAVTSLVANLTVIEMDFGDAPPGYPTLLADNGARHRLVPGIYLGAGVDFEPDGQPDAAAAGDDLSGTDDENGVTFTTPIRAGQTASVTVVASTNGILNAWLDCDRDGTWSQPGEQIFTNRALVAGANLLTFPVPPGVSAGASFARFRFSTAPGLSYDGEALDGEVEDHAVVLEQITDLSIVRVGQFNPIATGSNQTYTITVSNAGPSTASGVSFSDSLPAGVTFLSAVASQGSCTHSAGTVVCPLDTLVAGSSASITLVATMDFAGPATNTANVGGNQLDLNTANNTFQSIATVLDLPQILLPPQSLTVTNGSTATFTATATGSRLVYQWRFNGTDLPNATNTTLTVTNAQPANAGAYTLRITNEVGSATSAAAALTVLVPVAITADPQSQTVLAGSNVTLTVVTTGSAPLTYQWEFQGADLMGQTAATLLIPNAQTNHAGAYRVRVSNSVRTVVSATANLTVLVPPLILAQPQSRTNAAGTTATFNVLADGTATLRYQWYFNRTNTLAGQTNTTLIFTNAPITLSGDYTVVITNIAGVATSAVARLAVYQMDFGDAPEANGYPTTEAFNGARHRVVPGIRLGANEDFETNGLPSATATGDDTTGTPDDEDGVTFSSPLLAGQPATMTVVASTNGFIDAWIDFNNNGAWTDAGDQIFASRAVTTGTNVLVFQIPAAGGTGNRFARVRYSTTGGLSYDGLALDGEVEDYQVTIAPAIDLAIGVVDSIDPVNVTSNLVYTITWTNRGPSTAGLVWMTNTLPAGMTFISASPSSGFCGNNGPTNIYCLSDDMVADKVETVVLTVRVNAAGTFTNRVFVNALGAQTEVNLADNFATQVTSAVTPAIAFSNPAAIPIADATAAGPGVGSPYPSTINVTGLTGAIQKVTVTLSNMTHVFSRDLDVLLVSPGGQSVLLMSDAGAAGISGVTLTFDDESAFALPSSGIIETGLYRPTNYGAAPDIFPPPAPSAPFGTAMTVFKGGNPNGAWSLYAVDGVVVGAGIIGGGWRIDISTADPIADLAVSADATPNPVAVNSNLVYTVAVTNRGPAGANSVLLTNILPPGVTFLSATATQGSCVQTAGVVTCNVGALPSGAVAVATITARPTIAGSITNRALVLGSQLDLVPGNNLASLVTTVRPVTDLAIAQTASTNLALVGSPLTYTLQITNRGPASASNVRVTDQLPAGVNFISAIPAQGSCVNTTNGTNATVICDLGSLPLNGGVQILLLTTPTAVGSLTNTATVIMDEIDTAATNNLSTLATTVNYAADLAVQVVDSPDPVAVGGTLIYTITLTNRGPDLANGVFLSNALPPGVIFLTAVASQGACTNANGVVVCALGGVLVGTNCTITLTVTPTAAARLTNTVNVATSSIDTVPTNNTAVAVTDAEQPPFVLTPPQGQTVTNGVNVTFTVVAGGTGPLAYQWEYNGGGTYNALAGATNASLTLNAVGFSASGSYRVRITNRVGSVTSVPAPLTVRVPPTISEIVDQQTQEDVATGQIPFVIGDVDSSVSGLVLSALSSNPALVPVGNIALAGTGTNRTVRVTPATNQFGTVTITIRVTDGDGLVALEPFVLTVNAVNDVPTLSSLADGATAEDTLFGPLAFQVGDVETAAGALQVTASSSNPALVPDANITLGGSGTDRAVSVRPATNQFGTATITISVADGDGGVAMRSFVLTVNAVNDVPTLSALADGATAEDTVFGPVAFQVGDVETAAGALQVTVSSSTPTLVPDANITLGGSGTNRTVSVRPATNQFGTATITLNVADGDGGVATRSFVLTVNAVNDVPTIGALADVQTSEDVPVTVSLLVGDVESTQLAVTGGSSNTNLLADTGMVMSGSGTNRLLTLSPATNQFGSTTVSVTVRDDDGASVSASFVLTVLPVNDLPVISPLADQVVDMGTPSAPIGFTVEDVETSAAALVVSGVSSDTNLVPVEGLVFSGSGANRSLVVSPVPGVFGTNVITVSVSDGDGGVASRSFLFGVRAVVPPVIVAQPVGRTVTNGAAVAFAVSVSGTGPFSYEWRRNGVGLLGETNGVLNLTNVSAVAAGVYSVVVGNVAGSVSSGGAVLRVLVSPVIVSVSRAGGVAEVSFGTESNLGYTLEFKDSVEAPLWSPLGSVVGTGGTVSLLDAGASVPSRVYRLRVD